MRVNISLPLLFLASSDYVFASRRDHVHQHRARNHLMHRAEMVEPRAVSADEAQHPNVETVVGVRTITKTVWEDCAPTNTLFTTTTLLQDWGYWTPAHTQSNPTKYEPAPAQSEPTTSTRFETKKAQSTTLESTTTILMTTTITDTVTVTPTFTVNASISITTLTSSNTQSSAPVEGRPMPYTTKDNHTPQILQIPPKLGDLPGDLTQLLPGIATAVPVPSLPLDQVLNPTNPDIPPSLDWTSHPPEDSFSTQGFGGRSPPHGTHIKYHGNVGIPWGSNIITVSPTKAHKYKYVAQFCGANTQPWTVTIWNKIGPSGKMDGWYGHSALTFILAPGETRYVAFDEDSEGAWGAAPGTDGLPTDHWGGYTSTWGEFSFGDAENNGWSGWDVSAIQAQIAGQDVQGMRICLANGEGCSVITSGAREVVAAYTESKRHHDGIGGAVPPGPVRLVVDIDYQG